MKKRFLYTTILAMACSALIRGQENAAASMTTGGYKLGGTDSLMALVLENNLQLKAAREAAGMAILRAGTGNTPPDPQVEFGYLYGDPAAIGNKINIVVRQEVDFPTAYVHRSRLKDIRISRAELEYLLIRQEVLSMARSLQIQEIHLRQLHRLLAQRLERARLIAGHVSAMQEAGEVGAVEYSQASLMLASVESEYGENLVHLESNRLALEEIAGGREISIGGTDFPEPLPLNGDSLLRAYREGPGTRLYEQDRLEKEGEKKLAQSQHLPKLSAGYFSEAVETEAFRGFTVGLSLPLWENTRRVKTARSAILLSEAEMDRHLLEQEKEIREKLSALANLDSRVEKLEEALKLANTPELLASSVESGEISLAEYFYTSDFFFRNQQLLLRYKRDRLILEADLVKIWY